MHPILQWDGLFIFILFCIFFVFGGAGLSDPWHAGGRPGSAAGAAAAVLSTANTHMKRTNLTVATAPDFSNIYT